MVPLAVPPYTASLPPLFTMLPLAVPAAKTYSVPRLPIVVLMVVPYHVGQMQTSTAFLQELALPGMVLAVVVGAAAVIVPLWLGVRAFERLEA